MNQRNKQFSSGEQDYKGKMKTVKMKIEFRLV